MDAAASISQFQEWMRTNTTLAEGSMRLYIRTINHFNKIYSTLSLNNLNDFISKSFRDTSSCYVKYAFKYYLKFLNKEDIYAKLVLVKPAPKKRLGQFRPEQTIKKIIMNIKEEQYRDIAILQFATGARAREIITIMEQKIDLNFSANTIKVMLLGKGGKDRPTFLEHDMRPILEKYLKGQDGYLFISERMRYSDDDELEKVVSTKRTYYYNQLRKAAEELGIENFATHDFRRNVAEILKRKGYHMRTIQKVLGHGSINTTARYFDESPADVMEAMADHQRDSK